MTAPRITRKSSQVVNKAFLGFAAFILFAAGFMGHHFWRANREFQYFFADCSIYDRSGKILFHSPEDHCDFASDGKLLSSDLDSNTLQLRDKHNNILWTSNEYAHHDLKFSRDEKTFIVITAESVFYKNRRVKSDCFSKRDFDNRVLNRWCLGENIHNLEALDFHFNPAISDDSEYETNKLIISKFEISHANSIYEIPENSFSNDEPAFAEGNYLINIFSPSYALIILDREMKKVLWTKNLGKMNLNGQVLHMFTHDLQMTEDGNILTYVNYYQKNASSRSVPDFFKQVSLVKMNPISGEIEWLFQEKKPRDDFKSLVHGTVTVLKNNNMLYSVVSDETNKSEVYEISKKSEVVWSFKLPNELNAKTALRVKKAKPVYDISFLKARGVLN